MSNLKVCQPLRWMELAELFSLFFVNNVCRKYFVFSVVPDLPRILLIK